MPSNARTSVKPNLLLLDSFTASTEAEFEKLFTVHRFYSEGFSLDEVAPDIRAIATSGGRGAATEVVARLPELQIIAIRGVGTDGVDLPYARSRNIHVTTTPNLLTEDVADFAIALLLATARGVGAGERFVRSGKWSVGVTLPLGRKVTGMRIGIVGLGRVGRAIARRASGFGMQISYTDLKEADGIDYSFVSGIEELAKSCEALILAASGGAQSYKIVNKSVLEALGPRGILINVARGSLVDEEALVAALESQALGGAGLDVFAHEPDVPAVLYKLDNVVLQPHRASATHETRMAMEALVLENLRAHFAGEALPSPVP